MNYSFVLSSFCCSLFIGLIWDTWICASVDSPVEEPGWSAVWLPLTTPSLTPWSQWRGQPAMSMVPSLGGRRGMASEILRIGSPGVWSARWCPELLRGLLLQQAGRPSIAKGRPSVPYCRLVVTVRRVGQACSVCTLQEPCRGGKVARVRGSCLILWGKDGFSCSRKLMKTIMTLGDEDHHAFH